LRLDRRSWTSRIFSLLCLSFAIWNFGHVHLLMAATLDEVWIWYRVSSVGWCFGPPLLVHFFTRLSHNGWFATHRWAQVALYLPGAIFWAKGLTGKILARDFVWTPYGWDEVFYASVAWSLSYLLFYLIYSLVGLGMIWRWGVRSEDLRQRKQAWTILATGLPALAVSSVTNVLFRYLELHYFPGLAPIILLVWGMGIWFAIRRYRLMSITVPVASKDIIRTMADPLLLVGLKGDIQVSNPAAQRLFSGEDGRLTGKMISALFPNQELFERDHLQQRLSQEPILAMALEGGEGQPSMSLSASLVRGKDGEPVGAVIILRDVSEQLAMHARLARAEQAAQADRLASVGMLAAGVAHEINNPLTYVIGNLSLIESDIAALESSVDPDLIEELQECLQETREGSLRVSKIVADLKSFARADDASEELVQLEALLDRSIQMTQNQLKYRAKIVRSYGDTPRIRVNEGRLCQVFINLLVNAGHAIAEGNPDGNQITVRTFTTLQGPVVEVEDTGCGIPEEDLEQLFEPFFSTKSNGQGSGLGLSICKNIIGTMGGSIQVRLGKESGSCFTVSLPTSRVSNRSPTNTQGKDEPRGGQRTGRILVVDDEPQICLMFSRFLRQDHEVVTAETGEQAQALLDEDASFDLIISDLMMPQMDGMKLYTWISEHHPEVTSRIIFITGGSLTEQTGAFIKRVKNPVIYKPITPEQLRLTVQNSLEEGRATSSART
jgi:PAS domain S-box-containing protein